MPGGAEDLVKGASLSAKLREVPLSVSNCRCQVQVQLGIQGVQSKLIDNMTTRAYCELIESGIDFTGAKPCWLHGMPDRNGQYVPLGWAPS